MAEEEEGYLLSRDIRFFIKACKQEGIHHQTAADKYPFDPGQGIFDERERENVSFSN